MEDIIKSFPGYEFVRLDDGKFHNMYRGEDVGMGGYVYAEPGIYHNVALLDVSSMHPSSMIALNYFGDYTERFKNLLDARVAIKHKDFDTLKTLFDGRLVKYLNDEETLKQLDKALKIPINSAYGLTSASFQNTFRDSRNVNNIVALRGALFMVNLKHEVQDRGFTVAHIKTDSIKIPNATPEIISFVMDYGKKYGYQFDHEATYDRMCLVNNAVYIAKYDEYGVRNKGGEHANEWSATGAEFLHPYIFKTLFSKEPIDFYDYCETKSVSGNAAMYLDFNENSDFENEMEEIDKEINKLRSKFRRRLKKDTSIIEGRYGYDEILDEDAELYLELTDKFCFYDSKTKHDYRFVGKCGSFCPVVDGAGGGILLREKDGKYASVTGTKGYRWLEAENLHDMDYDKIINKDYYRKLVDDAIESISNFGDPYEFMD